MNYFPDEVLEQVFNHVTSHRDRNAVSLVCKLWFTVERFSRERVLIGNCYAISSETVISRFPRVKSLTLKGKPHFADFNLVPQDWGGSVHPWVQVFAENRISLEELRLKRMVVSDESLELMSKSFPYLKSLVLCSCEGFSSKGLAAIAGNCRFLRELDLQENEINDQSCYWLSCFPESCTSLVSLNFACHRGEINLPALERLVARCPDLKSLKLNRSVPSTTLHKLLSSAPQLLDLGTGTFAHDPQSESFDKLRSSLLKCKSLKSLSGFFDVFPICLESIYPLCSELISLNLSYAPGLRSDQLVNMICHCRKLQRLWILDLIGDKGLEIVASTCTELQELRVFPSDLQGDGTSPVTEVGLVAISSGCPKLHSLLYFCQQMTNAALIAVATNCPNFTRFRLCILDPQKPDAVTSQPLDQGFGAVVQACKGLRRLSLSGLLTNQVFFYIGMYANQLEMLSIAFAGESDEGMLYVLNGCKKLRKLEIMDSPFGDKALLSDVAKYETMRSLWMSSCTLTFGGCKTLAMRMPRLNVEIIDEDNQTGLIDDERQKVGKMYLYRTLVGPRADAPPFVLTL